VEIMGKYQRGVDLNESQIDKITSFLKALSGELVDYGI
ncbi:MAG: cytochrome-c peroxidase, partial [Epsilonproteobacteria bacterium]|nr:cytochrome-c peroxidase [Campylobacterota bacterium]NPA56909.1 cytochrome-c peroxidase [Campylobacterota bacterium]